MGARPRSAEGRVLCNPGHRAPPPFLLPDAPPYLYPPQPKPATSPPLISTRLHSSSPVGSDVWVEELWQLIRTDPKNASPRQQIVHLVHLLPNHLSHYLVQIRSLVDDEKFLNAGWAVLHLEITVGASVLQKASTADLALLVLVKQRFVFALFTIQELRAFNSYPKTEPPRRQALTLFFRSPARRLRLQLDPVVGGQGQGAVRFVQARHRS